MARTAGQQRHVARLYRDLLAAFPAQDQPRAAFTKPSTSCAVEW